MEMSKLTKGAIVGLAAGCATYMVANNTKSRRNNKNKAMQKKAQSAAKTIGSAMEELGDIMR